MEGLIAAIILAEEEDKNLLVFCMSDYATDIFKKRKDFLNLFIYLFICNQKYNR